jgi:hypothetical protein
MLEILANYDFKVQFLTGKKNVFAHALSRIEWPYEECPWPQVDTGGEEVCSAVAAAAVIPDAQTPVLDWVAEQGADKDISMLKQWLVAGRRPTKMSAGQLPSASGTRGELLLQPTLFFIDLKGPLVESRRGMVCRGK